MLHHYVTQKWVMSRVITILVVDKLDLSLFLTVISFIMHWKLILSKTKIFIFNLSLRIYINTSRAKFISVSINYLLTTKKLLLATMDLFTAAGLVVVLLALGWYYLIKPHQFWTDKGVPQTKPWLLFGDIWAILFRKKSTSDWLQNMYNLAPNSR